MLSGLGLKNLSITGESAAVIKTGDDRQGEPAMTTDN
jgi:hypothetical protein